jgi:hypothetical protein
MKNDLVTLDNEAVDNNINSILLLKKYTEHGKLLEEIPSTQTIQKFHLQQLNMLPARFKDIDHIPEAFPVEFSNKLVRLQNEISHGIENLQ